MSEFDGDLPDSPAAVQQGALQNGIGHQAAAVSAGTLLRQAREVAGLHIAALAVALKVPVKKLEALEADRLDLLPDAVFARALAASVCRTLKIDAGQVLALLPQTGKPSLGLEHSPINTPFRAAGDRSGSSLLTQISRPAVAVCLLLVLAALILVFLPAVPQPDPATQAMTDSPAVPNGMQPGVAMAKAALVEGDKPVDGGSASPSLAPVIASVAAPVLAPQLSVTSPPVLPAVVPAEPAPAGLLVFKAKGQSWVEVTDARGVVVVRRTLVAGEEVGASGVLPLAAVVGRADATHVEVRGKTFDLGAVSRDNVARFEVK